MDLLIAERDALTAKIEAKTTAMSEASRDIAYSQAEAALFDPEVTFVSITGPDASDKTHLLNHLARIAQAAGPILPVETPLRFIKASSPRFVFIDDLKKHGSPDALLCILASRVCAHRNGKVIVAGAVDEYVSGVNKDRVARIRLGHFV